MILTTLHVYKVWKSKFIGDNEIQASFCKRKKLKTGKTGKDGMNPEVVCQRER